MSNHTTDESELPVVAFAFEYYSEMAGGWVETIRRSVEAIPDPETTPVRNLRPLVALGDAEAMIEHTIPPTTIPDDLGRPDAIGSDSMGRALDPIEPF